MKELIGKKFKYRKYGLSLWTDTVIDVHVRYKYVGIGLRKPEILIRGTRHSYEIENVVFIHSELVSHWVHRIQDRVRLFLAKK